MEKTLYLHLGPGKTGSSAIQLFLGCNDGLLLKKGIHYIRATRDREGSHNPLAFMLFHKRFNSLPHRSGERYVSQRDQMLNQLADEVASSRAPAMLLSAEAFSHITASPMQDLLALFSKIHPGIRFKGIIYIRSTYDRFLSQAAQTVKYRDTDTNDERLSQMGSRLTQGLKEFAQGLDAFAAEVGKENLIFRRYGKVHFKGGNLWSDFLDALGLELSDEYAIPRGLTNKSLGCCETIYFKDVLNRLKLRTPETKMVEKLFEWEESNEGTKFALPASVCSIIEREAAAFRQYLLENYLDSSFEEVLDEGKLYQRDSDYVLSYETFTEMLNYVDSRIKGFRRDFMGGLLEALDAAYLYDLHLNKTFEQLRTLTIGKKTALWGCGDIAGKLFEKFDFGFLEHAFLCVVDADARKQGGRFRSHEISAPSKITELGVETVIIASVRYSNEITAAIRKNYPCVRSVVRLGDLRGAIEVVDL